jgi:hypothetical protein
MYVKRGAVDPVRLSDTAALGEEKKRQAAGRCDLIAGF